MKHFFEQPLMIVVAISAILALYFYNSHHIKKEERTAYILGLGAIFLVYCAFVSFLPRLEYIPNVIPILLLCIIFYQKSRITNYLKNKNELKATQDTQWGIPHEEVLKCFEHRIEIKPDGRKEIKESVIKQKPFYAKSKEGKKNMLNTYFYKIKNYDPKKTFHKVKSLKEIENFSPLISKIYKEMVYININHEKDVDIKQLLIDSDYYLEVFILDLWARTLAKEDKGVGTLNVIALNKHEEKLIGAIDSLQNSVVTPLGIDIFAHYLYFKGIIKHEERKSIKNRKLKSRPKK